jgi:hypothetical protein
MLYSTSDSCMRCYGISRPMTYVRFSPKRLLTGPLVAPSGPAAESALEVHDTVFVRIR